MDAFFFSNIFKTRTQFTLHFREDQKSFHLCGAQVRWISWNTRIDWFETIANEVDFLFAFDLAQKQLFKCVGWARDSHLSIRPSFQWKETANCVLCALIELESIAFSVSYFQFVDNDWHRCSEYLCCHFAWHYTVWCTLLFTLYTGCACVLNVRTRHMTHVQPNQLNLFA